TGHEETLSEFLLKQLHTAVNTDRHFKIGEFLIGNLDHNGFLRMPLEEVARYLDASLSDVENVLFLVQELGPTGVAARDLREVLLLQYLDKGMENPLVKALILDHLEDLGRNKLKDIARKLRVSIDEVKEAADIIRQEFSPRPAIDEFAHEGENFVPDPDVIVTLNDNGELVVELNEKGLPRLRKNRYYQSLVKKKGHIKQETEHYIKERLHAADEFMASIEKRRETLLKIANYIVERQLEFFFKGIKYLKPYTIKEVAEKIGVHESTVSRAVNGKFMATPRGVFELRFFFTTGIASETGEDTSRESIKYLLKELVDQENRKHPWSDQKLVELLKAKGVILARRTVTKYREELGILAASKRKEF
ncbi:MAG: RNA polymerase factor sigma-54, partial [Candidatus Wallbacteria bacterium]|nr:RNA polymerase factor sigma-54 [Candidatus Wallbacteria bacterium]